MPELDINEIARLLPHRYPFLLVDRVLDYIPMESITAIKNVTFNEPQFTGHFPDAPIMPGVLIVEAMAQTAAILGVLSGAETVDEGLLYYLVGVDKTRFRQTVHPGDQLVLTVRFVTMRRNIWKFEANAHVAERLVASAELLTTVADPNA